jgi:hypothetical protein
MKMEMHSQMAKEVMKVQKSIAKSIMEMEECQTQNILQILLQMTTFFVDVLKLKLTKD